MLDASIIKGVVITEKAMGTAQRSETNKLYVFKFAKEATKDDVKKVIENVFEVKVKSVQTLNQHAKIKYYKGIKGKKKAFKKAYVTLDKNYEIDLSESL